MKINFGAGGNQLRGWKNLDIQYEGFGFIDISKPLPLPDESVTHCFSEHCVEHVTAPDGFRFFKECYRILKPGGMIRITVPSIESVFHTMTPEYIRWVKEAGFGDGTERGAIEHLITNHGHLACWSVGTLKAAIFAAGFEKVYDFAVGESAVQEFCNIEGHGKVIGENNNRIESICVEGSKR